LNNSSEYVESSSKHLAQLSEPINRNPLTGRQEQGLQRIVRNYNKGKITRAQATDMLRSDFKFDDDRINTWLGE
jgi:hypothetical protein